LAYVEWMTPFHTKDTASGLYIVSRSTRMHQRHGDVIPVANIIRSCHLIPEFGHAADPNWTADTVGTLCSRFFVNAYIDVHTFSLLRMNRRNCI
ncbi:hypothetical protein L210DRAFT_3391909, partial [Boletus edulis BED1]